MLDKPISIQFKKWISPLADRLIEKSISATHVTVFGFLIGLCSVPLIALGYFKWAILCILINRICDGLDGLLAYKTTPTQTGAYLDILLDFFFYSAVPFAFILNNPAHYGLPAGLLLYCFVLTGSSFLIAAIFAEKNQIDNTFYAKKSFYYSLGLIEATETTLFFILLLLLPDYFSIISYTLASLCLLTVIVRVKHTLQLLKSVNSIN